MKRRKRSSSDRRMPACLLGKPRPGRPKAPPVDDEEFVDMLRVFVGMSPLPPEPKLRLGPTVLRAFEGHEARTLAEVSDHIRRSRPQVQRLLMQLVRAGEVEKVSLGVYRRKVKPDLRDAGWRG